MHARPPASGFETALPLGSSDSAPGSQAPRPLPRSWAALASSGWWRQLECVSRSILMLDYDGTLAPFVRERMQAKFYPGVAERLLRLAVAPRTRLVLISGRPARELASLLPRDLHVEIWGSHGRERLGPDGSYSATPLTPLQQKCLGQLESALQYKGFSEAIEKKVGSLAMHTRGLTDSGAQQITSLARDFYCALPAEEQEDPGLEWLAFDGGVELRGAGYTKATAVHSILREEPPHTPAAYLGDDQTDEDGFAALHAGSPDSPALCVLVRTEPRPSAAGFWLRPPEELLAFLDRWLEAVVHTEDPL